MELSVLCSFFVMLFIVPFILNTSVQADNDEYDECKKTFLCGTNNVNLSYPFYDGEVRSSLCGYNGFLVDCSKSYPEFLMASQTFYLLSMNETSDAITVILKSDYDGYCPDNLLNIDFKFYKYASTNENITIYYGCPQETIASPLPPCRNVSNNNNELGYVMTQSFGSLQAANLSAICSSSVVVPAQLQAGSQFDPNSQKLGFGLEWNAENKLCDGCRGSDGVCGSNEAQTKFACHCSDGTHDFDCNGKSSDSGKSSSNKAVIIGLAVGGSLVAALLAGCCCFFVMRRKKRLVSPTRAEIPRRPASLRNDASLSNEFHSSQDFTNSTPSTNLSQSMPSSFPSPKSDVENISSYHGVKLFSYNELDEATDSFKESRQLGDGGFGVVYYGVLRDGRGVAVKRLYENSIKRMGQFMNEVTILAHLRHDNLVTLFGCTSKTSKDLLLVYEYIPNGTVADHLHGKLAASNKLTWPIRLNIAVETAEALYYLHNNDVIHRDVKTTNILLNNDFQVKVADFGLSRLFPNDVTHVSTAPQGTPGYVDPYYYQCFRLTEKSDVYSFGVVLIELISSKMAVDVNRSNQDINLALMAVDRIKNHTLSELVDPNLGYDEDYTTQKMVNLTAELAFQCLQHDREMRPSMKEVLETLRVIQTGRADEQKQVVVYIQDSDDEVRLLKNAPPFSPETDVNNGW